MGETLPFAVDAVRPSVVQIRLAPPGEGGVVLGTGFILHAGGYALTAKHVTEAASREIKVVPTGARLLVGLATPNIDTPQLKMRANFELLGCEVVEEDARHDLALLKLTPNPFETGKPSGAARVPGGGLVVNGLFGLAPLTIERPRDGASIAVSGYPMLEPTLVTTSGIIASAWGTDLREVVPPGAASGFTIPDMADSYLADVAVNPGNSGGPMYLASTGAVLGVCVAFRVANADDGAGNLFSYNSGLSIIVPIRYGIDLLARHVDLGRPGSTGKEGAIHVAAPSAPE